MKVNPTAPERESTEPQRLGAQSILIICIGFITVMGGALIAPGLPELARSIGASPTGAGLIITAHGLAVALLGPFVGLALDRVGRIRILVPALFLNAVVGIGGSFAGNLPIMLLDRFLLGITLAGIMGGMLALAGDLHRGPQLNRVMGLNATAMNFGGVILPVAGGFLASLGWRYPFFLYGAAFPLGLATAVVFRDRLRSPQLPAGTRTSAEYTAELRAALTNHTVITLLGMIGAAGLILYTIVIYLPLRLEQDLLLGPAASGIALGTLNLSASGASLALGYTAHRLRPVLTYSLAWLGIALSLGLIPYFSITPTLILAAVFGFSLGCIMTLTSILLITVTPAPVRGATMAMQPAITFLGIFLSPILFGPIADRISISGVYFVASASAVAMTAGTIIARRMLPKLTAGSSTPSPLK